MNFWQAIEKPIIGLSPMDGVTDSSFRFITAKYGRPDVTVTEFVNVAAAYYAPETLIRDLTYSETERPIVAQIYGNTPEMFYKVAHVVCELGFDGLDLNMGCPAKRVAAAGSGAALIANPQLARAIIRAAQQGINDWSEGQTLGELKLSSELIESVKRSNRIRMAGDAPECRPRIPLSVKTRLGYDCVVVEEWIQTLIEEKLTAISVHGRTLAQGYKGNADWDAIGRAVAIGRGSGTLILGNGDLQGMSDVHRRVHATGVDGVLLGRAAQGNPWIFEEKDQVKRAGDINTAAKSLTREVSLDERFQVMLEHSRHFEKHSSGRNFVAMRKHLAWYCAGFRGAAELRSRLVRINDVNEVAECLSEFTGGAGDTSSSSPSKFLAPSPFPLPSKERVKDWNATHSGSMRSLIPSPSGRGLG
jgi:tRNA-dihydrouridine synthase